MDNHILLKNGLLIDGTGKEPIERINIEIQAGIVSEISFDNTALMEKEYDRVIDLNGYAVLPGFINSHVHAGFKYLGNVPCREFHEEYLRACLDEGITTVRDEGMFTDDRIEQVVENKRILEASMQYPRVITTGKFFSAPKGYGGTQPIEITTEEEARQRVKEVLDAGIDMIKTVLEDGLDPSTFGLPKLSDEILTAICDEAHKRGARVSAHVTQAHNLKRLVQAGIDDAGHMVYDHLEDELAMSMIQSNIYIVPTLTVLKMIQDKFGAPILETGMKNVYRFVQMGGKLGLGDDFIEEEQPWYRLGMPKLELQLLKEAGLTNMEIILAATKHGAEICGIEKEVGTIEVGKKADIFIVEGNPLENLHDVENVRFVIKDGVIVVERRCIN